MDYLPDADQNQIVEAFRDFLTAEMPLARLLHRQGTGSDDAALWPHLGELGWLALSQDEAVGGSGLGIAEEMLLFIEAGRHLLSPLMLGSVLGARVLHASGAAQLARDVVAGTRRVGLAIALPGAAVGPDCVSGDYYLLDAEGCDHALICTRDISVVLPIGGLDNQPQRCTDESVSLSRLSLRDARPLASTDDDLVTRGIILSAAMLVGISDTAKQLSVDYSLERQQFGKAIGSFQAIKHYCADMALRHEAALSLVTQAALEAGEHRPEAGYDALAAKLTAANAAISNAETAIQIHGAMGFTREMPIHLLLKRAHLLNTLFADESELVRMLADIPTPDI